MLPGPLRHGLTGFVYFLKLASFNIYHPPFPLWEWTMYKISFCLFAFILQTQSSRMFHFKNRGKDQSFSGENWRKMGTKTQKAAIPSSFLVNNPHAASSLCLYSSVFNLQIVSLFWQAFLLFLNYFPETFYEWLWHH